MSEEAGDFGRLAVQLGYLSEQQLVDALLVQQEALRSGFRQKLGSILVDLGYLSEEQFHAILSQQNQTPQGVRIGGFEITGKLGAGAMGNVYKARQIDLDRTVALKVLRSELAQKPVVRERFLAEARAVARLNHPNIVSGISVGCEGGKYYFAMEYVEGVSLAEELHSLPDGFTEEEALEYVRQVALALQHAHNRGLLHRDIKPDNILVTNEGQAKLTDLGIARALDRSENPRITQHGLTVGTPHYVSPEQARGNENLTRAADLYALGATLYHLLTGRVPYEGDNVTAVMIKHVSAPIPDPRCVQPAISATASAICMRLMEKSPGNRYPSAVSLAEDLERALRGEPIRHAKLTPHPTRRSEPIKAKRSPRRPGRPRGGRRGRPKGLVSSIAKRLGL